MRRVPSCLFFAAFALFLGTLIPEAVLAQPGVKHGPAAQHRAWGGHKGFNRGHWSRSRHGLGYRGYARHAPAFRKDGFKNGFGFYGRGFQGHGRYGYPGKADSPYGYARQTYGRHGYGHYGSGRHFYGHHGYGRSFYGRPGYGHHGFFPRGTWVWPSFDGFVDPRMIVEGGAPPGPVLVGIPSIADLPASTGIRSAPAASPAVYVLGSGKRSLRSGGAKIVSMDQGGSKVEAPGTGPRIIRLDVPRGR